MPEQDTPSDGYGRIAAKGSSRGLGKSLPTLKDSDIARILSDDLEVHRRSSLRRWPRTRRGVDSLFALSRRFARRALAGEFERPPEEDAPSWQVRRSPSRLAERWTEDDLTNEIAVKVIEAIDQLDEPVAAQKFIDVVVVNFLLQLLMRDRTSTRREHWYVETRAARPSLDALVALHLALEAVPDAGLFVVRHLMAFSDDELPIRNAAVRRFRARSALIAHLLTDSDDPSQGLEYGD